MISLVMAPLVALLISPARAQQGFASGSYSGNTGVAMPTEPALPTSPIQYPYPYGGIYAPTSMPTGSGLGGEQYTYEPDRKSVV